MAAGEKKLEIYDALKWAEEYLKGLGVPDPLAEAEYLLAHILKCRRVDLFINRNRLLTGDEIKRFKKFINRRTKREPSQYIISEVEFRYLIFKVTRDVLIPRPETEFLVEEAAKIIERQRAKGKRQKAIIIDLCTGSGCIAVSAAKEIPDIKVYATDISGKALLVAKENAKRHGAEDRIIFLQGNFLEPLKDKGLEGEIDIILSNPPYVSKKDMEKLQPEIKDYEPLLALYGGEDGLDSYRKIITEAFVYLKKGGYLILEIGYGQAEGIKKLFAQNPAYTEIEIIKDLAGIERVVKAKRG